MSGSLFHCGFGAILQEDADVLEACLEKLCSPTAIVRICEIGCHDGGTALGLKRYCDEHGCTLEYWGIDPDYPNRTKFAWAGANIIALDSAIAWTQVPGDLDLVWVDGCHCYNHVILDTLHYAKKVRNFGFLCFHDINPQIQGIGEKQPCGPANVPEFNVDVVHALESIRFPWAPWDFFMEKYPTDVWGCGTRAYRKGRQ